MEKRNNIIAAAIIAVGFLALGICIKAGIDNMANSGRQVTVRGLSEREVLANRVKWPISFNLNGNDLQGLNQQMQEQNRIIIDFLKENGLEESDIIINPPSVIDQYQNSWSATRPLDRYQISSSLTVKSNKVEAVRNASFKTGELIQRGIILNSANQYDTASQITYEFTDFQDIKLEMTRESIANAQAAATEFAKTANSKIGTLITGSQGSLSISNSDSTTPHIQKLRVVSTMTYALN